MILITHAGIATDVGRCTDTSSHSVGGPTAVVEL